MFQSLNRLKESPSQTAGPYVHIGLTPNFAEITGVYSEDLGTTMVNDKTKGERITIKGRVLETAPETVKDIAADIASSVNAEVVHVIGRTFVLYRRNPKDPVIDLPRA